MLFTLRGTLLGLFAMFTWTTAPTMVHFLKAIPPFQLTALTFTIGFLAAAKWWLLKRNPAHRLWRAPARIWLLGVTGLFGFHFCYFLAFRHAPAVDSFLIIECWPLLMIFLAIPLLGESLKAYHVLGTLIGFAGLFLAVTKGRFDGFDPAYTTGYLLASGAAIIWAGYSALSRKWSRELGAERIWGFCGATGVLAFIVHLTMESWVSPTTFEWSIIFLMGLGPVGLSFFAWNVGMREGNIHLISICALGIPLLGTLFLILFGASPFSESIALATILVVGGAAIGSGMGHNLIPERVWKRFNRNN